MRQQDLLESLDKSLSSCTILVTDADWPFGWDLTKDQQNSGSGKNRKSGKDKHKQPYNVRKDKRLKNLLSVPSDETLARRNLNMIAMTIVSGLCRYSLQPVSVRHMDEMLSIAGVTSSEMNIFAGALPGRDLTCFGSSAIRPAAVLLFKVLWDALCENCGLIEWIGTDQGRPRIKPARRSSQKDDSRNQREGRNRLQALVTYMRENRILELDCLHDGYAMDEKERKTGENEKLRNAIIIYDDFFRRHAVLSCKRAIIFEELERTVKRTDDEAERIHRETDGLMMQALRKAGRGKTSAARGPVMMPEQPAMFFRSPEEVIREVTRLLETGREEEAERILDEEYENLPHLPEMSAIRKRARMAYQALDTYNHAIRENCIEAANHLTEEQTLLLKADIGEDIAECALVALMNGDECFWLEIGRYVFSFLGRLLGIPEAEPNIPYLHDEDEWDDYIYPGDNGKLAQAVVKENETILFNPNGNTHQLLATLRISGALAEYSGFQFNEGLYIRKSHVSAFREMGYSERRSRDFAIIVSAFRYVLDHEDVAGSRLYHESKDKGEELNDMPAAADENEISDDVLFLTKERDEALKKCKAAERECQRMRHDAAEKERAHNELEEEIKRLQEQLARRDELIDAYACVEEELKEEEITFPFITDRNVVLYGGFRVFHTEIEKLIPGIRIVETASHIDTSAFRNADIIFLQINRISHSSYWNVCETAKNSGVPYYHLNFASAKRCAEEMVKRIRGLSVS